MNPSVGWGRGFGRGFGRGRGFRGRGRGRGFYLTGLPGWARWGPAPYPAYGYPYAPGGAQAPQLPKESEIEILKEQSEFLQNSLSEINERLEELQKEQK
jgi:hypothetical protein